MNTCLQNSASIQPRTSPAKFSLQLDQHCCENAFVFRKTHFFRVWSAGRIGSALDGAELQQRPRSRRREDLLRTIFLTVLERSSEEDPPTRPLFQPRTLFRWGGTESPSMYWSRYARELRIHSARRMVGTCRHNARRREYSLNA